MSEPNNAAPVVLDIRGLTKKFPLEDGRSLTACDNISLRVYKGQTLGIIGESGCGKSTLVRTLLSLHPATSGEVIYHGENLLEADDRSIFDGLLFDHGGGSGVGSFLNRTVGHDHRLIQRFPVDGEDDVDRRFAVPWDFLRQETDR